MKPTPRLDPSEYQVVRNGLPVSLTNLSREELLNELALAMDAIEELDNIEYKMKEVIAAWRSNRPIPQSDVD